MECPEENEIVDYVRGDVDETGRRAIEAHLDDCPACLQVVGELARIFQQDGDAGLAVDGPAGTLGGFALVETSPMEAEPDEPDVVARLREGAKLGRYVVLSRVGSGGMGVVFAAYDPELDRKVAIKVLRGASGGTGAKELADQRARLLREAQAMAKLSHPNVITVHDVGTFEGQVFVAMEFIDGGTLSMWLRESKRTWREVQTVMLAAGRGLAAAHAAGLVHRDFKPDNVLMGTDGRVLVTDFGLARPAAGKTDAFAQVSSVHGTSALGLALTQTGALVGTPAYMAPEQLGGERTDALTDQFSFCVATYESLYGERPFAGKVLAELIANVTEGAVRPPPPRGSVPRWVRRALLRGLSVAPEQRFRSTDALLAALARDPWRRWQQALLIAVPTVVVGIAAMVYEREQPRAASYCQDVAAELGDAWDEARREAVAARFEGSALPYAADALRSIERTLDDYAEKWTALQTQACRDEVEGARPQAVLALQMTCLERRRLSLGALTSLLAEADPGTLERAVDAAGALPSLEICADLEVLMARESTQDDVDPAAARAVDGALARVKVLRDAARYAEALAQAGPLIAQATDAGYTRGEAFARELLATTLELMGDIAGAERAYHDALSSALASGSAEIVVRASLGLIWITADPARPLVEADRWHAHGKGALARMGGDFELEAELERALGLAYLQHDDPRRAETHVRESLRIREQAFGPEHESIGAAASTMGQLLAAQGKYVEARAAFERALAITEARTGPSHPDTAAMLTNVGSTWAEVGDHERAIAYYERALAIDLAALGPDHVRNAIAHHNLASVLWTAGRRPAARAHAERELAIVLAEHGELHPDVASALGNLARFDAEQGDHAAALAGFSRAYDIVRNSLGPDSVAAAHHHGNVAIELILLGRAAEAIPIIEGVIATRRGVLGDEHRIVGEAYIDLARALVVEGRFDDAIAPAERGLAIVRAAEVRSSGVVEGNFTLARARWDAEAGRDRSRAIEHATLALELAHGLPMGAGDAAEIAAWLQAHR